MFTSDGLVHVYEIVQVKRHALDLASSTRARPAWSGWVTRDVGGAVGHEFPKLQVRAELLDVRPAASRGRDPDREAPPLLRRVTPPAGGRLRGPSPSMRRK